MAGAQRPVESIHYDFIIIGSGYGGMLPAWRLTLSGAKVLLIERGHKWFRRDFQHSWDALYLNQFYDYVFSNSQTEIYRSSRALGGGSVTNSLMHMRTPSEAFDFVDPETHQYAWPLSIRRQTLDPYYAKVEELMQVHQLSWDEIPRIGGNFARLFNDAGLSCDRGRFNIGSGCVRCGFCEAGCQFRNGKISLVSRTMHEAVRSGNLDVEQNFTAAEIRTTGSGYAVDCIPTEATLKGFRAEAVTKSFSAKKIILAAGTLGTVPLLWRSWGNLMNLSNALGRWANNNGDVNFVFVTPPHYPDHWGHKSRCNAGTISYAFWQEHRVTMHPGMAPVAVQAGIDVRLPHQRPWGLSQKQFVKDNVIHRMIPVNAMRQTAATHRISINDNGLATIDHLSSETMKNHGEFMYSLARSVADRVGAQVMITGIGDYKLDMGGNHLLGGARMAESSDYGVVDSNGEVFGHPGLYVTDGAAIPSALGINPALTIGANALRIADHLVQQGW